MPYVPFHDSFPEIAEQETRSFTVFDDPKLPAGNYGLVEMYCDEPGCDCRRVFLSVVSSSPMRIEAVIAYGWESSRFYAKWMGDSNPKIIKELKGPILNVASPQSDIAPLILEFVKDVILQDKAYIQRLKSHYRMFRDHIDNKLKPKAVRSKRKVIASPSSRRGKPRR